MAAIEISDVTSVADTQGEIRLNLGDVASGTGFGSNVTLWGAGDHFIGIPVAATSTQGTQALWTTIGNLRVAIATRDARWQAKQGNLAAGDAAIVSDCDAGLLLKQADNTITLSSTNVSVTVDGQTQTITAKHATGAQLVLKQSQTTLTLGVITVQLDNSATPTLAMVIGGNFISMTPAGIVIVGPTTINGTPF